MNLKMDVFKFVENYVNKRNKMYNTDSKVYDPPVWQYLVKSEVKTHIRDDDGVPASGIGMVCNRRGTCEG